MKLKKIGVMLLCMAGAMALMCMGASAAVSPGVYTASMVTSYYNLDTGNVDDGGTANAALGEGMCRSATDKTALVEVDKDGNVWVTVRLLLQSNCSNIQLYKRSGYDSYSAASHEITAEDSGKDSIDYRIKVSEPGQKLKCTMYVSPMGRDVLWYLYVDTSTLKEGSGDFAVSIDLDAIKAAQEMPKTEQPAETAKPAETTKPAETAKPAETTKPAETAKPAESAAPTEAETPTEQSGGQETPDVLPSESMEEQTDDASASDEPENTLAGNGTDAGSTDENTEEDVSLIDETGEDAQTSRSGVPAEAIAMVVIVLAAAAAIVGKKRKKA